MFSVKDIGACHPGPTEYRDMKTRVFVKKICMFEERVKDEIERSDLRTYLDNLSNRPISIY